MSEHEHDPSSLPTDDALIEELRQTERRGRTRATIIFVTLMALGAAAIALGITFREELFRPRPDMEAIEQVAEHWSNDPACRELITQVDTQQQRWRAERQRIKGIWEATDPAAIDAGRQELRGILDAYALEERRLEIAIFQDRDTQTAEGKWIRTDIRKDIRQYFKHVIFYLKKMDSLLAARQEERVAAAQPPAEAGDAGMLEVPGLGSVPVVPPRKGQEAAKPPEAPAATWERAWSMVTEDQEKWRIFRQGPLPCGHREGDVPALPAPSQGNPLADIKAGYGMTPSASAPSASSPSASVPSASAPSASAPSSVEPPASAPSP